MHKGDEDKLAKMKDFKQRMNFLGISIVMNAAGNALTISTNLGSAVWTGSTVNLSNWIHIPLGTTLFIYGIVITIANQLLLGHFDRRRLFSNLLYAFPFSYLVSFITLFWNWVGVPGLGLAARVVLDTIGIMVIAAAVSIYQRSNILLHPNDDLSYILRFKFLKGSAILGQWVSYTPPILITIASVIATGQLKAIGYGTILALVAQGMMMSWSETHVFPQLKHHIDI
ncbi:integral membrane protein [Paucilactobacillus wasatchensis]|uniref:Integral membrane protein n=1 Tax=Paucilactobacillus wasatchensis TaxID=1335616 RepID=A0A0D1AAT4_9LACO|nr:integral membrane protein [Paucilactobacillus wasatchensis]